MIGPGKAAGMGARAGARRTSSPTRNAAGADQSLLADPGYRGGAKRRMTASAARSPSTAAETIPPA